MQHSRRLRSRRLTLRVDGVVADAAHNAQLIQQFYRFDGVVGNLALIREYNLAGDRIKDHALGFEIPYQDGG